MNRFAIATLAIASLFASACGDGASTDPFLQSLFDSVDGLSEMIENPEVQECVADAGAETVVCACPGGGELTATRTVDRPTVIVTRYVYRSGCTDEAGLPYVGGQVVTDTCHEGEFPECTDVFIDEVDFVMPVLGECVDATALSVPDEQCGGSVTATCRGTTKTCSAMPVGDECEVSCS